MSVNKVILIGCLGRDPEVRHTQAGAAVVTFSLATDETWRDKASGERKQRTEWHNVVIFNEPLGKTAAEYLKKGSQAYLEGQLATREYTDKDGVQRKVTEVVLKAFRGELTLLGGQQRSAPSPDDYGTMRTADDPRTMQQPQSTAERIDDNIPF